MNLVGDGVPFVRIEVAGEQTLFELVRVFEILHTKEDAGAGERHQDEQLQLCLLIGFSGMHSHHHGVAAHQKDDGVQKPEVLIQVVMGGKERVRKLCLREAEPNEQASEQQDFCRQEQPHTKLAGIELLFPVYEMVLQVRVMRIVCMIMRRYGRRLTHV